MTSVRIALLGRSLCIAGAAVGGLGLLGWVTGATSLTTVVPGQPTMMPNTAVALVLAGTAGALRHREQPGPWRLTLSILASIAVLIIGAGTLFEYIANRDLGIDELIIVTGQASPHPGRPSPLTALALTCLSGGLLLF